MKHTYYVEIAKEAEMAEDEQGNPAEGYVIASFDSDQTYYTEKQVLNYLADVTPIPLKYMKIVSKEEYKKQMGESA